MAKRLLVLAVWLTLVMFLAAGRKSSPATAAGGDVDGQCVRRAGGVPERGPPGSRKRSSSHTRRWASERFTAISTSWHHFGRAGAARAEERAVRQTVASAALGGSGPFVHWRGC